MHTIVTLIDFSNITPLLLEKTERLAKALRSKVVLLHVVTKESRHPRTATILADYKRLAALGGKLSEAGLNVMVEQLTDANPAEVVNECRTWDADIIIVGLHHHNALYHLFVGSLSDDLLKMAHCPVLVVPSIPVNEQEEDLSPEGNVAMSCA